MNNDPLHFTTPELEDLERQSLLREVRSLDSAQDPEIVREGKRLLLFASNNYLGLANDPRVVDAAAEAARRWGVGMGSARLITGSVRLHDELEASLAALKRTESALVFSSGYLANLGTLAALAGNGDAIFSDELNHASIIDGARLSHADVHIYRHGDVAHLDDLLRQSSARRKLVVTDTVFSMDGDLAPLPEIAEVCERREAILMVDEAHATGVVGPGGRGAVAHFGLEGRVPVVMGTLSKALGSAGGYIAGTSELVAYLRNTARAFIFDTAMPAPVAAAAQRSVEILLAEPERVLRVRSNAARLADGLGLPRPDAAILPVVVGSAEDALRLAHTLEAGGILVPAIRPPTVAPGTARLRATVMATHTDAHIDAFVSAFERATVPA
ncbi:MAG TPA: 8-amino-7-oxononanoate synthase [Actinomycetota bacterium]|nr:8-amino-7-oxononanoate synthase [Actinomycetota bacterium]